jgi:ribose 5-phosphate isomerase B
MKLAIGADHRGYKHKECIKKELAEMQWVDVGTYDDKRSDYPIFAKRACLSLLRGDVDFAVLICGTGIGMSIAANRYKKVYAALVWDEKIARQSKSHDAANVLVIPSDYVSCDQALLMVRLWINTQFVAGRYLQRRAMIDAIDVCDDVI